MPVGLIGGAIISGAYFGDKMSPLSDTTNLAPAMVGADLFTHIKYMMYTTIPSFLITLIIFLILGFTYKQTQGQNINELLGAINNSFNINGWLFLVPILIIILVIKRVPAIPALFTGVILGGIFAIIFQPQAIKEVSNSEILNLNSVYVAIINAMGSDIAIVTKNEMINNLLTTKGMSGMLNTIWLIISAMCFGGAMESSKLLKTISNYILKFAKSTSSLIISTGVSCVFCNITASYGGYIYERGHDRSVLPVYFKSLVKTKANRGGLGGCFLRML